MAAMTAFLVQAVTAMLLYGTIRKMQRDTAALLVRVHAIVRRAEPIIEQAEVHIDKTELLIDSMSEVVVRIGFGVKRARPLVDKGKKIAGEVQVLMKDAGHAAAAMQGIVDGVRPVVKEVSGEVRTIVRTGRAGAGNVGSLVHEVADRARARRDQIDEALERRRRGLERASKVVLRPVRVVNGIAAAVVTTVTTLVRPSGAR